MVNTEEVLWFGKPPSVSQLGEFADAAVPRFNGRANTSGWTCGAGKGKAGPADRFSYRLFAEAQARVWEMTRPWRTTRSRSFMCVVCVITTNCLWLTWNNFCGLFKLDLFNNCSLACVRSIHGFSTLRSFYCVLIKKLTFCVHLLSWDKLSIYFYILTDQISRWRLEQIAFLFR